MRQSKTRKRTRQVRRKKKKQTKNENTKSRKGKIDGRKRPFRRIQWEKKGRRAREKPSFNRIFIFELEIKAKW